MYACIYTHTHAYIYVYVYIYIYIYIYYALAFHLVTEIYILLKILYQDTKFEDFFFMGSVSLL